MPAATFTCKPDNSTDANFQNWCTAIDNAIVTTLGWVATSDTGQGNPATATHPTVTNTAVFYRVYKSTDSGTAIYLKVEYGSAASAANPQIWTTVGTGSDGAGNITGTNVPGIYNAITPRTTLFSNTNAAANSTTAFTCYVNGDGGNICLWLWPVGVSINCWGGLLLVERCRDYSGAVTNDGFLFVAASCSTTSGTVVTSCCAVSFQPGKTQPILTGGSTVPLIRPTSPADAASSALVAGTLYPLPVFTGFGGKAPGPSKYIMIVGAGDCAAGQTYTFTHLGVSANWIAAGPGSPTTNTGFGAALMPGAPGSFLIRTN